MPRFLFCLTGLVVAAIWLRVRPVRSAGRALLYWVLGVLLARIPSLLLTKTFGGESSPPASVVVLLEWAGALLTIQALWYLVHVDRIEDRKLRRWHLLFAASFLLHALFPGGGVAWLLLALPLVCSFRWRFRFGAVPLLIANLVGLASFLFGLVKFGSGTPTQTGPFPGLEQFTLQVRYLATAYAVMSLPMSGSRIHLSIRRISRRLTSSHLLAALIPFALGVLFLLVSGALFLSTYRSIIGIRLLKSKAESVRELIAARVDAGESLPLRPFGEDAVRQAIVWRDASGALHVQGDSLLTPADSLLSRTETSEKYPLLWDGRALWLRARFDSDSSERIHRADRPIRVEALALVDSLWLARISRTVGESVRIFPGIIVQTRGKELQLDTSAEWTHQKGSVSTDAARDSVALQRLLRSIGPAAGPGWRIPGGATLNCLFWSDQGWSKRLMPIASGAGFGEQVAALFAVSRENPFAIAVLIALGLIALFFLGTIAVVSNMVLGMGRSITRAVQALTEGTRALREGKLDHRIAVQGNDELWSVAASFNEMAEGLEKIRTMELEQQRMDEELRLAKAIQMRLLPAAPPPSDLIELAGLSLPAREVGGDYYDYLQLEDGRLGLAVADVSGKGTPAALLMSAFRASLRSQDLSTIGPAEALGRINRFIHESVDPGKFITAFLALIDPATGDVRYANAGHDAPLVLKSDGTTEELTGGGLILGMLPQIVYEEARAMLDPGSLLAVYTDGVTEARNEAGDFFGPERLLDLLRATRGDDCSGILQRLVREIETFAGSGPQSDDITVILARRR